MIGAVSGNPFILKPYFDHLKWMAQRGELPEDKELEENDSGIVRPWEHDHRDGWGIAYLLEDGMGHRRSHQPVYEDSEFTSLASFVASAFILHARNSSGTPVDENNSHPFKGNGFFLAHNGSIHGTFPDDVEQAFKNAHPKASDSRKFTYWLNETWKDRSFDGLARTLRKVIREYDGHKPTITALNLLILLKERLFAFKYVGKSSKRKWAREYYTLHYTEGPPFIISSEPPQEEALRSLGEWKRFRTRWNIHRGRRRGYRPD